MPGALGAPSLPQASRTLALVQPSSLGPVLAPGIGPAQLSSVPGSLCGSFLTPALPLRSALLLSDPISRCLL